MKRAEALREALAGRGPRPGHRTRFRVEACLENARAAVRSALAHADAAPGAVSDATRGYLQLTYDAILVLERNVT